MKRTLALTTVLFLFSTLFIVGVCVAGGPVSTPTTAKWTGTLYDVGYCAGSTASDPIIHTVNIGKGNSSVMGAATFLFVYCVELNFSTGTGTGTGWGIATTANGDTIRITIPTLTLDLTKTPAEWSETEFIVGGTGKFENAIGTSFSHGTWTSGTDTFPFGTSEYPPLVFMPPQGWGGTSKGEIMF